MSREAWEQVVLHRYRSGDPVSSFALVSVWRCQMIPAEYFLHGRVSAGLDDNGVSCILKPGSLLAGTWRALIMQKVGKSALQASGCEVPCVFIMMRQMVCGLTSCIVLARTGKGPKVN